MAVHTPADGVATEDRAVVDGVYFLVIAIAGQDVESSTFLDQDIPFGVLRKIFDIPFEVEGI